MTNTPNPTQPIKAWYVATEPNQGAKELLQRRGWHVTEIKRGVELVAACEESKSQLPEAKRPDVVLLGDLDDLSDSSRDLVGRIAEYGIDTFVPMFKSYLFNHDLLTWLQREREETGLNNVKIVGFGPEKFSGRPLAFLASAVEGQIGQALTTLEQTIRPTSPRFKEGPR